MGRSQVIVRTLLLSYICSCMIMKFVWLYGCILIDKNCSNHAHRKSLCNLTGYSIFNFCPSPFPYFSTQRVNLN